MASFGILRAGVARDDWGVVEQGQETSAMFGKNDLLLGALNGSKELRIVGFLEFLSGLYV